MLAVYFCLLLSCASFVCDASQSNRPPLTFEERMELEKWYHAKQFEFELGREQLKSINPKAYEHEMIFFNACNNLLCQRKLDDREFCMRLRKGSYCVTVPEVDEPRQVKEAKINDNCIIN